MHGKPIRIRSSADAIAAGIGMVHQHFMLVDTMSVAENVMLGMEGVPSRRRAGKGPRGNHPFRNGIRHSGRPRCDRG